MANSNTATTNVGTSATPLALPVLGAANNCLVVANLGSVVVYVGGSNVSATNGIPIAATSNLVLPGATGAGMYALAASTTANVTVGAF